MATVVSLDLDGNKPTKVSGKKTREFIEWY